VSEVAAFKSVDRFSESRRFKLLLSQEKWAFALLRQRLAEAISTASFIQAF
jgi:hypothetical protein